MSKKPVSKLVSKLVSRPDDGLRGMIVHGLQEHHGETVFWQPIETALTATGVPDLYGCWRGTSVWIECKATEHWRVSISEFQVGWLARLGRAGGRGFVAVRRRLAERTARREKFDQLWLVRGELAHLLRTEELRRAPTLWGGGWDWRVVGETLFGGC